MKNFIRDAFLRIHSLYIEYPRIPRITYNIVRISGVSI